MKYITLIVVILTIFLWHMPKGYSYCVVKIQDKEIPFRNDAQQYNQYGN